MKTNYLTLFFTVATFAIILILFYFVIIDVFYKPLNIKAENKIDEVAENLNTSFIYENKG